MCCRPSYCTSHVLTQFQLIFNPWVNDMQSQVIILFIIKFRVNIMSEKSFSVNATHVSPFPVGLSSNSPWEFCSFEPLTYIYFNIAFIIIAYPLYRIVGGYFHWELDVKTPSTH